MLIFQFLEQITEVLASISFLDNRLILLEGFFGKVQWNAVGLGGLNGQLQVLHHQFTHEAVLVLARRRSGWKDSGHWVADIETPAAD